MVKATIFQHHVIADGNFSKQLWQPRGFKTTQKAVKNAVIARLIVTNNSIKWDTCSLLDLEIKRLVLHCDSSFARTPLFFSLALVGFPSCNLLKFSVCCHLLVFQLQPQCGLCYIQSIKGDLSGPLCCPFLAGSQSVLCTLLLLSTFSDPAQLITLSTVTSSQLALVFSPPSFSFYSFIASACHHKTKQNPHLFLGERGETEQASRCDKMLVESIFVSS